MKKTKLGQGLIKALKEVAMKKFLIEVEVVDVISGTVSAKNKKDALKKFYKDNWIDNEPLSESVLEIKKSKKKKRIKLKKSKK